MGAYPNIKKSIFTVAFGKGTMIALQFLSFIILARMLSPEDYGITAMLAIFISVSTMLVDSGFGGSLIYQERVDERDFSTIFWINIVLSTTLYGLMFALADDIASFYKRPDIKPYIRVLGLVVFLNSLGHIQFNQLYRNLEFSKINIVNLSSYLIATIISIVLAYFHYGVWALICQQVLYSVISTITYVIINRFRPKLFFSWNIVKKHWSYGSGLFFSTITKTIYDNMYLQLIGKYADVYNAGVFNQANKLKDIPATLFSTTFDTSLFPIFSKIRMEEVFATKMRRVSSVFAFVCAPVFILMGLLAKPIIILLLGYKWIEAAPLLSILSVGAVFFILESVNRSGLKSKGLSMLLFKMDLTKRFLFILVMFVALLAYGIYGLAFSYIINSFCGWIINAVCLSRYVRYTFLNQFIDVIKPTSLSLLVAAIVYSICIEPTDCNILNIFIVSFVYIVIYALLNFIIRDRSMLFMIEIVKNKILHAH